MRLVGAEHRAFGNTVRRYLLSRGATLAIAAALFAVAYDGGSYGQVGRSSVAIAVWWAVILGVAVGIWPTARVPRGALVAGGLLAGFALLTLASTAWAASAEGAFADFDRASLHLGVFAVVVLAGRRSDLDRWSDGVALATTGVAVLALTSRLLPDLVSSSDFRVLLPAAYSRLSYPLGYWNALAILVGLGVPLVLRSALAASRLTIRGLSLAAVPPMSATIYLTSSRGGVATAILALIAFVALTSRRVDALVALLCAAPGTGLAIAVLLDRNELVNDPAASAAESQGSSAALTVAVAALVTGVLYAAVCRRWPSVRLPRTAGRIIAVAAIGILVVGVAAARPLDRFRTFKQPPAALAASNQDYVRAHLLSGNGSGRWQFWRSAVKEFESRPLFGRGGGSYEAWWAEHGTLNAYVKNAHSLYLETLGELGAAGFLLLCAAFAVGLILSLRRVLRAAENERLTVAALAAAFAGYVVAAGIDWIWELTAVSVVGFVLLGLLVGPASAFGRPRLVREEEREAPSRSRSFGLGIGVVVVAWLLICAHAIPLLANIKLRDSQAAAAARNPTKAVDDALAARNIQPWAATPYLQLALVTEAAGARPIAKRWIDEAIKRDQTDWRLWLVAARLETNMGNIRAARRSLARARHLNPRSPLFRSQPG